LIELNHLRRGEGEPLLLIHTLGGSIVMWEPVLDRLSAEREVIAVDMPGFGDSPSLPDGIEPSAANLARAIIDFYDTLGIGRDPAVAGISLGAWTAIECARMGRATSVVALCPAGFWREPGPPGRNLARPASRALGWLAPALMRIEPIRRAALAGQMAHPERVPPAAAAKLIRDYGRAPAYPRANDVMSRNVVADLADVSVPITIGWADHDRVVRRKPLKDGILPPAVRQVELPDCGHVPTWDAPELVSSLILEGGGGLNTGGQHVADARQ